LTLSGTKAATGSTPLRLVVTDAGSNEICSIQFNTAGLSRNLYLRQRTDGTSQFTAEGRFYALPPAASTADWATSGIVAYGPGDTDLALVSSTYNNGARLVYDGTGLAIRSANNAAHARLYSGQLYSDTLIAGYAWYQGGIVCNNPSPDQTPFIGIGGHTYGGSIRLNQSNGQFELLNGTASGYLALFTGGLRIQSYGAPASATLEYNNSYGRSSFEFSSCDGTWHYHHINVATTYDFIFRNDGNMWALAFNATSDRREKDNIETLESPLAKALALDPVTFNFIGQAQRKVGLIAQDVAEYLPEAVGEYPKGEETRLSLDYNAVATLAIGAIKELTARLEAAEARITKLEDSK
jgi:hypothetical protein